ncbi:MAG: MBL fold metallo-hydrolase [Methanosarcinaceae archaeon]|nr:MBL fold metallo-hydrolase [Methanosarcinaceae archaeon]
MNVQRIYTSPYDANAYIINGKVLIDTGISPDILIRELEKYINITDLELIILTHCHIDHTGAAAGIAVKSGAKVAIHKEDALSLKDDVKSVASLFGRPAPAIEPDIIYIGGESVPINNENLEVIHTPGHTPGGICLYEPGSKSLFSGDTVFPNGSLGRTDFLGGSPERMAQSIQKLTQLDVRTLYPGHGEVTSNRVNEQILLSFKMSRTML